MTTLYLVTLLGLLAVSFAMGRSRSHKVVVDRLSDLHSLPVYHGLFVAIGVLTPMIAVLVVGLPLVSMMAKSNALSHFPMEVQSDPLQSSVALRDVRGLASGSRAGDATPELQDATKSYSATLSNGHWAIFAIGLILAITSAVACYRKIAPGFRSRRYVELFVKIVLGACAVVAILTTIGILFSVVFETYRFFFDPSLKGKPTIFGFLFGLDWNPQAAMRADQGELSTAYGFVPLLVGSLLITFIAICVAGPLGLYSAIYLAEYATPKIRATAKPILEILAGIPTVVLGFFAALTVAPLIRNIGTHYGLDIASESALAAGLVMGMMIIPFISSLSDDVINAVPQSLRDGAYALGATKSETIRQVILPAALPGIVSAFMLAISRAIGETMIVVMAAGLAANLTINPLAAVTTITVQIKTILVGDQEFDSAKTLAAFALGFVLFFVTLMLNFIALRIVQKYREQYD
ncbi:MAG: phosphate ABC transporter permease subunit PstC [Rhizobiales bacterium]|nr:phosphate ABC transporter permease subunit PstC [Hyphomicrobiales bacterium]